MIKKINSKNKIFYDNKFSIDSLIPRYSIQFDLANGRLVSSGKVFTSGGVIDFKADSKNGLEIILNDDVIGIILSYL